MSSSRSSTPGQRSAWLAMVRGLVPPVVATFTLFVVMSLLGAPRNDQYAVLSVLTFVLTLVVYKEIAAISGTLARRPRDFLQRSVTAWTVVVGCLAVIGFALQFSAEFSRRVLLTWAVLTPILVAGIQYWSYIFFTQYSERPRRAVIAGVSDLSRRLAAAIAEHPLYGMEVAGWFEDRSHDRTGTIPADTGVVIGRLADLPDFVRTNKIDVIYIALPIRHEERTKRLLDELHDSTASIYFVPDIFVFDLIQSRVDVIDRIPVLALRETPFVGTNGLIKRTSDVLLASVMLVVALPVILLVAIGVAATTSGSVIFKQRRYGLDGHEIVVYKFRSMSTSDDADNIQQAQRDDKRITPFGRFIRRYSLDELPQLVNVLQGRMSLVGPRPHAVAHNEEYRHLIKGYMIRHKVAPGITGLAQIRGYRGETQCLEDMRARVESDLEYLRRWSLFLDLKIIAITMFRIFHDKKAY